MIWTLLFVWAAWDHSIGGIATLFLAWYVIAHHR